MNRKTKTISFREHFRDAFNYLKESQNYIYAVVLIFASGILFGFLFSSELAFVDKILIELLDQLKGLSASEIILFILQNNLKSAFYGMAFGVLLGLLPIISSFFNGLILGYVMHGVWIDSGISEFWRILPHGVFELPAVFISLALGLKLGMFIFAKKKGNKFIEWAKNSMIIFVFFVIPLLIFAAIIEGLLISVYR